MTSKINNNNINILVDLCQQWPGSAHETIARALLDQQARIAELEAQLEAVGAGGVTGLRGNPDSALWCVHVYGPDDVHAMASRADALEEANGLNAVFAQTEWDEHTPIMTAVVEPWPYSPDSHAVEVAKAHRAAIAQEGGK